MILLVYVRIRVRVLPFRYPFALVGPLCLYVHACL